MKVLGIETSCDETGVAVYDTAAGLRAHAVYSQIELHAQYGGVVPELASRDHVRKLLPLIRQTTRPPAGPYALPRLACPRYRPIAQRPNMNKAAVSAPPNSERRLLTGRSGSSR